MLLFTLMPVDVLWKSSSKLKLLRIVTCVGDTLCVSCLCLFITTWWCSCCTCCAVSITVATEELISSVTEDPAVVSTSMRPCSWWERRWSIVTGRSATPRSGPCSFGTYTCIPVSWTVGIICVLKNIDIWKLVINKKVLLRERKRHTYRRVASARSWPGRGRGTYLGWGRGYLPWTGEGYLLWSTPSPILIWPGDWIPTLHRGGIPTQKNYRCLYSSFPVIWQIENSPHQLKLKSSWQM